MSWSRILGPKEFIKGFIHSPRQSDTIFSPQSQKLVSKKLDAFLKGERSLLSIDTERDFWQATQHIASIFGVFITQFEKSYLIRGKLELIKRSVEHPVFGKPLDLFAISNPFASAPPFFLYATEGKIKTAGVFGEAVVKELVSNRQRGTMEGLCQEFYEENLELKIPLIIQDIIDFDEVFAKRFDLKSNTSAIRVGDSKEITSFQKLWLPSVSGEAINGHIEGINAYSLISSTDSGSIIKEKMDSFVSHFQPSINAGNGKFSMIDFDLRSSEQLPELIDPKQRTIQDGRYLAGYRANVGTVISHGQTENTKACIQAMRNSPNTDYVNVLDELSIPTDLLSRLGKEKLLVGNLRYHLLSLNILPVKYSVKEAAPLDPQQLRMAIAIAKASPYLLDPISDEILVSEKLKDIHLRAASLFKKDNAKEVDEYIDDHHILR